jgi:Transposase IS66 family
MVPYAKFALHRPLNRQSEAYARENADLPLFTLAVLSACAAVLAPVADIIGAHVFAAASIHADDTLLSYHSTCGKPRFRCAHWPAKCENRSGIAANIRASSRADLRRWRVGLPPAAFRLHLAAKSSAAIASNESL